MANLIVILGDQLNLAISSLADIDKTHDTIFMSEVFAEAQYVKHHQLKIAFLFSAMRHFAIELAKDGYKILYSKLDDPNNTQTFAKEIQRIAKQTGPKQIIITEPSEWRVLQELQKAAQILDCPLIIREDDRFYCQRDEFTTFANHKKQLRLELFYRYLRKKHNILMENSKPLGGQWNYDSQNRKRLPKSIHIPQPTQFKPSTITREVLALVEKHFNQHPGSLANFHFAVTHTQAEQVLADFIAKRLNQFGDYQDAMALDEPWLFHSHISFYLNCGLLLPRQVIAQVLAAFERGLAPLNAVEGFIRQILGWREFIRGIYWFKMPEYANANFFNHKRSLPALFWTGKTSLKCLSQALNNTLNNAYAHHIERLMIIGNFALLMEFDPREVQAWYLAIYADAYEWVEMPNVIGMILHADGGYLASKPYIASGNYINKMSNYCTSCPFNVKKKTGETACPFNYLYWDFLQRHQSQLGQNPRLSFPYRNLANMAPRQRQAISESALTFREQLINEKVH